MAWTQADLDSMNAAIASGEQSVKYPNGSVEYRSLADMERIKGQMEAELGITPTLRTRRYASTSKGL